MVIITRAQVTYKLATCTGGHHTWEYYPSVILMPISSLMTAKLLRSLRRRIIDRNPTTLGSHPNMLSTDRHLNAKWILLASKWTFTFRYIHQSEQLSMEFWWKSFVWPAVVIMAYIVFIKQLLYLNPQTQRYLTSSSYFQPFFVVNIQWSSLFNLSHISARMRSKKWSVNWGALTSLLVLN